MREFLKALFLVITFLMMLSVVLLSMLMILLSTLSMIRPLICGNHSVLPPSPLPPPFLQGGAKIFEAFLKRVGLEHFYFFGGVAELQGAMVFSRRPPVLAEDFQPESLNQWSNISFYDLKTIRYFLFSHSKIFFKFTAFSLCLKWQCFKSCPYLLDFKSHAFCTLWVWQTGVFAVGFHKAMSPIEHGYTFLEMFASKRRNHLKPFFAFSIESFC